jgi:hypothetical protein
MKYTIETQGKTFTVSAKFIKAINGFPNCDKNENEPHNQFLVSVNHNGITRRFSFYGSTHDYNNGIVELNEVDTRETLQCFISDALAATNTFDEFCNEFGYDEDSRKAYRIFKLCEKTLTKTQELGLSEDDLANIWNDLNERS